jgi:hypothetical protein
VPLGGVYTPFFDPALPFILVPPEIFHFSITAQNSALSRLPRLLGERSEPVKAQKRFNGAAIAPRKSYLANVISLLSLSHNWASAASRQERWSPAIGLFRHLSYFPFAEPERSAGGALPSPFEYKTFGR